MRRQSAAVLFTFLAASGSAGSTPAPGETSRDLQFTFILPEVWSGWACVDFGVEGASDLRKERESFVIEVKPDGVVQTSFVAKGLVLLMPTQVFIDVGGQRHAYPLEDIRGISSDRDPKHPVARRCVLFGTEEEADRAGEVPRLIREPVKGPRPECAK